MQVRTKVVQTLIIKASSLNISTIETTNHDSGKLIDKPSIVSLILSIKELLSMERFFLEFFKNPSIPLQVNS